MNSFRTKLNHGVAAFLVSDRREPDMIHVAPGFSLINVDDPSTWSGSSSLFPLSAVPQECDTRRPGRKLLSDREPKTVPQRPPTSTINQRDPNWQYKGTESKPWLLSRKNNLGVVEKKSKYQVERASKSSIKSHFCWVLLFAFCLLQSTNCCFRAFTLQGVFFILSCD